MRPLLLTSAFLAAGLQGSLPARAQNAPPPADFVQIAKYVEVHPGQEKTALTSLQKYSAATQAQPGNLGERVLQEAGRPARFLVVERWKDAAAYKAHLETAATTQLDTELSPVRRAPNDERVNGDFMAQDGGKPAGSAVFVATHVDVNPPNRPKTEEALKIVVDLSRKESGAVEFNIYRPSNALNHFTVYETWSNAQAFEAHSKAQSNLDFRRTIAPLMGALYDERIYQEVR